MEILKDELNQTCKSIIDTGMEKGKTLEYQTLQQKVIYYLNGIDKNLQGAIAQDLFQVVSNEVKQFIQKLWSKILCSFKTETDPLQFINTFCDKFKEFNQIVRRMKICIYYLKDTVNMELEKFALYNFNQEFNKHSEHIFKYVIQIMIKARSEIKNNEILTKCRFTLQRYSEMINQLQENDKFMSENNNNFIDQKIKTKFYQTLYEHQELTYEEYFQQWKSQFSVEDYLRKVQEEIAINSEVIEFDSEVRDEINKTLFDKLLKNYKPILLEEAFQEKINVNDTNVLKLVGTLYAKLNDHYDKITQKFKEIVQTQGVKIIYLYLQEARMEPLQLITNLYHLYSKYHNLIVANFNPHSSDFNMALNNAFENFMNMPLGNSSFSEYLVQYINEVLKVKQKSARNLLALDEIVQLFNFITDKQEFFSIYQWHLAQRLLQYATETNINRQKHLEEESIQKMENRCGTQDLESLRKMLLDVKSKEVEYDKKLTSAPIIMNQQYWPKFEPEGVFEHPFITEAQKYIKLDEKKKLTFIDQLSSVEIFCSEKNMYFEMSVTNANILFQFNNRNDPKTARYMSDTLNIPINKVIQYCQQLVQGEILVVQNEQYSFNMNMPKWNSKKKTKKNTIEIEVLFPAIAVKTQNQNDNEKDIAIEALVVRVMKKAKQMGYLELIQQIHLNFHDIEFNHVKSLVEKLISKEYIERDQVGVIKYKQ